MAASSPPASDDIPFPHGWERRYDNNAKRHYYIDHVERKTQWVDPRLHYASIWTKERTDMLQHLGEMFKTAKEDSLREVLLEKRFVEWEAVNHLLNQGYSKSSVAVGPAVTNCAHSGGEGGGGSTAVSPKTTQSPNNQTAHFQPTSPEYATVKRSPKSPRPATGESTSPRSPSSRGSTKVRHHREQASHDVDHFTIMHMKALFPETTDEVLVDVLNQCGRNVDVASRELVNMGYGGRQKADTRIKETVVKAFNVNELKKQQEKEEREKTLAQLKREFESFLDADISDTFSQNQCDLYVTRAALRRREAELKLQTLATAAAESLLPASPGTVTSPTIIVEAATAESLEDAERRRSSLSVVSPATKTVAVSKTESKFQSTKDRIKASHRHAAASSAMADVNSEPGTTRSNGQISKSTGATPSHFAGPVRCTLAKGPDVKLRHGSDPSLRIGTGSRAAGSDPTLRRGPNPQLRQGFNGDRMNSAVAVVAVR